MKQTTSTVLMVRPTYFAANEQTAIDNVFQKLGLQMTALEITEAALQEAEKVKSTLTAAGVTVLELDGPMGAPDAVFPNNWFITDDQGRLILCPMMAENRRLERRLLQVPLHALLQSNSYQIAKMVNFRELENQNLFCEGTGSLVLDRIKSIAYAAVSGRTSPEAVEKVCDEMGYRPVLFRAVDRGGEPIYHTNVILSLGSKYAVACLDSVEVSDREIVLGSLRGGESSNRVVLEISWEQVQAFGGNILELAAASGESFIIMSQTAQEALTDKQLDLLEYLGGPIISVNIPVIEAVGGGGVRCMLAEIFLPKVS